MKFFDLISSSEALPEVVKHQILAYSNQGSESITATERIEIWSLLCAYAKKLSLEFIRACYQHLYLGIEFPFAWLSNEQVQESANIRRLLTKHRLSSYSELYNWSIENKAAFWSSTIEEVDIRFDKPHNFLLIDDSPIDPSWLEGAKLNIVNSCFKAPKDHIAIKVGNESGEIQTYTYDALQKRSNQVSNGLLNLGLREGDPVVLFSPLSFDSVAAYLGIIQAGMTVVSVPDSFSTEELQKRVAIAGAQTIITCISYQYNEKSIRVFEKAKQLKDMHFVLIDSQEKDTNDTNCTSWKNFLGQESFEAVTQSPNQHINILFSSGTTKAPKAIPWTHMTPIKAAVDAFLHQDVKSSDTVTWTTGMGWMMAPWLIYASLINNATMALFEGSAAHPSYPHFLERAEVSILGTIPSLVKVWRKTKLMESKNFHVRLLSSTGEPSNEDDYFYLMSLFQFKAPVIEYCGGTEIGGGYLTGSVYQHAIPSRFTTPTLGTELYFLENENKEQEVFIVPPVLGLSQELLNKNHYAEYYEGTPKTANGSPLRKHGDCYTLTHDAQTATTYYQSKGRSDDSMNLGGIKVSAIEIESLISLYHHMEDVAAISYTPQGSGPEALALFIVSDSDESEEHWKKEFQKTISSKLNPLFKVGHVQKIAQLPRTASNKVMRRSLRTKIS